MKRLTLVLALFAAVPPCGAGFSPRPEARTEVRATPKPELDLLVHDLERFPATRGEQPDRARLARFFDLFWATRMQEAPDQAIWVGYHGVHDYLPDYSPEALALEHRIPHLELAALSSIDRAQLTPAEQLNYDLAHRRFEMELEAERFKSVDPWTNDYLLVDQLTDRLIAPLELPPEMPARTVADYEAMLALLRGYPRVVDQGIALLNEGLKRGITPPRVTLARVPDAVLSFTTPETQARLLAPFGKIPDSIPAAERERLHNAAAAAWGQQVVPAVHKLHDYLATTYVPHARESIAVTGLPGGKEWYAYLLRYYTTTNLTPEQIHQLGLTEVARIRAEMETAMAQTGFKGTYRQFVDFLRTDPRFFYTNADELVAGYRDIAKRIDPELPKLFGKLPRLPYGVKPMDDAMAKSAPSAYYDNGVMKEGRPGWMLINTFDLKSRPKWAMESLTAHEAVPGHHLQYAIGDELTDLPEWRRWEVYPVFSEGWGLYAEGLAAELGLYKDPYSKFGQLNNELWRAMRLVLDTGLHAKGWTRQQAIDYCKENSAKPNREIENEIDRYIVQPGSTPAYKVGQLKIRELRAYAQKELGAKFDLRAFHDELLGNGQLPLDLLEARIKEWVKANLDANPGRAVRTLP